MTDPLHKLLMQSGMVSADFPEHLGELFAMDGKYIFSPGIARDHQSVRIIVSVSNTLFHFIGTQAKRLLAEYDIEVSESREKNLNRFMQFVGVSYQMVSRAILQSFVHLSRFGGISQRFNTVLFTFPLYCIPVSSITEYPLIINSLPPLGSFSSELCWGFDSQWLLGWYIQITSTSVYQYLTRAICFHIYLYLFPFP